MSIKKEFIEQYEDLSYVRCPHCGNGLVTPEFNDGNISLHCDECGRTFSLGVSITSFGEWDFDADEPLVNEAHLVDGEWKVNNTEEEERSDE